MLSAALRCFLVAILLNAWGCQWFAVKMVAWGGMLATYMQTTTVVEAITETFSGKKPCSMCLVAQRGAESQEKQDVRLQERKGELFFASSFTPAPAFIHLWTVVVPPVDALTRDGRPPFLPPRSAVV